MGETTKKTRYHTHASQRAYLAQRIFSVKPSHLMAAFTCICFEKYIARLFSDSQIQFACISGDPIAII